jgi:hypothetical protein
MDPDSGFYYLRARYYDPSTAQFVGKDPAVGSTREPYAYVRDNPLNKVDPTGLSEVCIGGGIQGLIGFGSFMAGGSISAGVCLGSNGQVNGYTNSGGFANVNVGPVHVQAGDPNGVAYGLLVSASPALYVSPEANDFSDLEGPGRTTSVGASVIDVGIGLQNTVQCANPNVQLAGIDIVPLYSLGAGIGASQYQTNTTKLW